MPPGFVIICILGLLYLLYVLLQPENSDPNLNSKVLQDENPFKEPFQENIRDKRGNEKVEQKTPQQMFKEAAQNVYDLTEQAAVPEPPSFEPLDINLLPQKLWQPAWVGYNPMCTDGRCKYSVPNERSLVDIHDLMFQRNIENAKTNMREPPNARQIWAQLATHGVRSKKDVYTQASVANDILSQNKCAQLKIKPPEFVNF